ncbi:hypothetical protein LTS03_010413 [Exophiala xenobiotica]|nr:hypothetical protein LTS03_010413 [Exophiala xenobiotica]
MLELSANVIPLERTVEDISMDEGVVAIVIEGFIAVDDVIIEESMVVGDIIIEVSMAEEEDICARALFAKRRAGPIIALNNMVDDLKVI